MTSRSTSDDPRTSNQYNFPELSPSNPIWTSSVLDIHTAHSTTFWSRLPGNPSSQKAEKLFQTMLPTHSTQQVMAGFIDIPATWTSGWPGMACWAIRSFFRESVGLDYYEAATTSVWKISRAFERESWGAIFIELIMRWGWSSWICLREH